MWDFCSKWWSTATFADLSDHTSQIADVMQLPVGLLLGLEQL